MDVEMVPLILMEHHLVMKMAGVKQKAGHWASGWVLLILKDVCLACCLGQC